jgi:asparagine synthase (glutamine-hydrolysing)
MCGIAGLLGAPDALDLAAGARRMAAALVHRGPDDEGIWIDSVHGLAFAHRRLAIIDVSPQGHQPMHSATGRYVIVYNGEIYNFEEIRRNLEASGCAPVWRGHSDTEVLLAAIEAWGFEQTLVRLVGMFALAVWDRHERLLSLARDRIGEKPLYYGEIERSFYFASELKAIRAVAGSGLDIDDSALSSFMQFGYVPSPYCIYRGLRKLAPGHFVHVRPGRGAGEQQAYWGLGGTAQQRLTAEFAIADDESLLEELHGRLQTAVRLQMVSDVPIGAFLSGGVDSSAVVALMQSQSDRRVRTFTIGFHEKAFDEAPYAKAVAEHLGTDHTELYVSASEAASVIPDLPLIYDEPFADSSQIPTTLVSRLTRQHVTVSLSGDGGDELFAGYPRYAVAERLWRMINRVPRSPRTAAAATLRLLSPQTWDRALLALPGEARKVINGQRIHRLSRILAADSLGELYVRLVSHWQPEDDLIRGQVKRSMEGVEWPAEGLAMRQMRKWDLNQYLPDDLLVKVDRAAMSASLESRAPLLDHRVVEFAYALPDRVLVQGSQGKWILRKVLDRYVPRKLIDRPKAGFSIPLAQWLRGPLREWAADLLSESALKRSGLLSTEKVSSYWLQHQSGSFDRSAYLWNVLVFQTWLHVRNSTEKL